MRLSTTVYVLAELGDGMAKRMLHYHDAGETFHFTDNRKSGDVSHLHTREPHPQYSQACSEHMWQCGKVSRTWRELVAAQQFRTTEGE